MRYFARHEGRRWEVIEVASAQIVATFQEHGAFDAERQAKSFAAKLDVSTPKYSVVHKDALWSVVEGDRYLAVFNPIHLPNAKEHAEALVKELLPRKTVLDEKWSSDAATNNIKSASGYTLALTVSGVPCVTCSQVAQHIVDIHNRSLDK